MHVSNMVKQLQYQIPFIHVTLLSQILNTVKLIKCNYEDMQGSQRLLSVIMQKETQNDSLATLLSKQNEQLVELLVDQASIENFQSHIQCNERTVFRRIDKLIAPHSKNIKKRREKE